MGTISRKSVDDCQILRLRTFTDGRGSLTVAQAGLDLSFQPSRVFFLHGFTGNERRGAHAHLRSDEALICVQGGVTVDLFDGEQRARYRLSSSSEALYIAPTIWVDLHEFDSGSIILALASHEFEEADYIRDLESYLQLFGC